MALGLGYRLPRESYFSYKIHLWVEPRDIVPLRQLTCGESTLYHVTIVALVTQPNRLKPYSTLPAVKIHRIIHVLFE